MVFKEKERFMNKEAEICNICGRPISVFLYKAVIIGGGCAGLNCADTLFDKGVEDIALVTNGLALSTSINTGSDKQTYYKLSTAGAEQDCVLDMARTLYDCGGAEGFHCLTEAAMSLKCFYKLVSLGVDFPQNEYGEYVGYRTDHDKRRRATSCGPLTSKFMAEALIKSVKRKNIDIHENLRAARLIVNDGRVRGVLCADTQSGKISVFLAPNIVLATGGPAGIYASSVYPACHSGALGLAMEAGCTAVNLTEWQYGIASTDFRWNLSGSYMQVIPRFVSVDKDGTEREFLSDYIEDERCRYNLIFQKGYNWPFSPEKLSDSSECECESESKNENENKSSLIDLAVYLETCKGRNVYLDFTRSESGFAPGLLNREAADYLESCGVLTLEKPIDRLKKMNLRAYRLYLDSAGIDLEKNALKIAVCAQHNNGGIDCDINYMTNIDGLYAAGECAGVFGAARPGGTALNSTQVSSCRAAEHIAKQKRQQNEFCESDKSFAEQFIKECAGYIGTDGISLKKLFENKRAASEMMSEYASFVRIPENLIAARDYIDERINNFAAENRICDKSALFEVLNLRDILISARCVLEAMIKYSGEGFLSRGGFLAADDGAVISKILSGNTKIKTERDRETVIKVKYSHNGKGGVCSFTDKVSPIPESEQWFEKVYERYYD